MVYDRSMIREISNYYTMTFVWHIVYISSLLFSLIVGLKNFTLLTSNFSVTLTYSNKSKGKRESGRVERKDDVFYTYFVHVRIE